MLVSLDTIEKPLANGASVSYKLDEVISKTSMPSSTSFELSLQENGRQLITQDTGACKYFYDVLINADLYSCDELPSATSGVFRHENGQIAVISINK